MKQLNTYITEKLRIDKDSNKKREYHYKPETSEDLKKLLKKLVDERGPNADLNDIDVSGIHNMNYLFWEADIKDIVKNVDVSEWDVSHVTDMCETFSGSENFDCDLSKWDVHRCSDMNGMFSDCKKFTGKGLEKWDVRNVRYMENMFENCDSLPKIPSWWDETLV